MDTTTLERECRSFDCCTTFLPISQNHVYCCRACREREAQRRYHARLRARSKIYCLSEVHAQAPGGRDEDVDGGGR